MRDGKRGRRKETEREKERRKNTCHFCRWLTNIVLLLSISFVVSRARVPSGLRTRLNGVENFFVYRSIWKYVCTYSIFYFGLQKKVRFRIIHQYHVLLLLPRVFFWFVCWSVVIIVAGGRGTLFAIEDLWPWLWNSLNTLIFTRAHLTMRYIALFLFHCYCNSAYNWKLASKTCWFDQEQVKRITKIAVQCCVWYKRGEKNCTADILSSNQPRVDRN